MNLAEHTMLGIDRILNGSSHSSGDWQHGRKSAQSGAQELPEECSPCDDACSPGVVASQTMTLRWKHVEHERFVAQLRQLLRAGRVDDALDVVETEYLAINGPEA
jgi:hypothetical protein